MGLNQNSIFLSPTINKEAQFFCKDNHHKELVNNRFKNYSFHAEELWMAKFGSALIEYLNINKHMIDFINEQQKESFDLFWLDHYNHPFRLEFVLNTAPCCDCQNLFKSLREKLNEKKLYIPIIIYALYPYQNNSEVELSPIQVLSFSGELIFTKIFSHTQYNDIERKHKSDFAKTNMQTVKEVYLQLYSLLLKLQKADLNEEEIEPVFNYLEQYLKNKKLGENDANTLLGCLKPIPTRFTAGLYHKCYDTIKSKKTSQNVRSQVAHIPSQGQKSQQGHIQTLFQELLDVPKPHEKTNTNSSHKIHSQMT